MEAPMNPLLKLRTELENGDLSKQEYIESVHRHHLRLFNYPSFIADTDVESLRVTPEGIFVRSRSQSIELLLVPNDQHLIPYTLMNFRSYEKDETNYLKKIANNNWTVIDIGANCGWHSLSLAKAYPGMTLHACEPISHTYDILQRNIRHNGLNNIHAHLLGFSNKDENIKFLYTPSCSGATSITHAGQPVNNAEALQSIICPCTTLDKFCEKYEIIPQLIKCDVEGAELLVMQGSFRVLDEFKPVVLIELLRKWAAKFGYHPNDVFKLMTDLGYQGFTIDMNGLTPCDQVDDKTEETNFIFLHSIQHVEIICHE